MSHFRPFRSISPRQLGVLFAASALLPAALLIGLGWRLLQQESALAERRQQESREQSADLVVTALRAELAHAEERLRTRQPDPGVNSESAAVLLTFDQAGLQHHPDGSLLYVPQPARLQEVPQNPFADAEVAEYQDRDRLRALQILRRLAASDDRAIQAGAFLGIARNLTRLERISDAVATYREAERFDDIAMHGVPIGLLARSAICMVLEAGGQTDRLWREAHELERRLVTASWSLSRAAFDAQLDDLRRWLGREPAVSSAARGLSDAAAAVWSAWRDGRYGARVMYDLLQIEGVPYTVLARAERGGAAAFLASPQYVERRWLAVARQRVRNDFTVALEFAPDTRTQGEIARRSAADSGLPWTVVVSGFDTQSATLLARRRTLWLAGTGIMLLLIFSVAYVMQRLVARELAVARLKSDFVATVSHEFRTPLTSLRQLSEMLVDGAGAPLERRLKYYDALQRQTERLQRLVESLLDFSRLESGTAIYSRRPLDLASLAQGVVDEFRRDPAARNHRIEVRGVAAAWISGDPEPLRNALWNLLDNAAKYSPPSKPIVVEIALDRRQVAVVVRDHGTGIPLHEQKRIFEKFVRGERARHDGVSGTGVGLAIAQQIVRAHGGSIDLSSIPGEGTAFAMRLPGVSAPRSEEAAQCLES